MWRRRSYLTRRSPLAKFRLQISLDIMPLTQRNHLYDAIDPSNFAKDALKDKVVLVCTLFCVADIGYWQRAWDWKGDGLGIRSGRRKRNDHGAYRERRQSNS